MVSIPSVSTRFTRLKALTLLAGLALIVFGFWLGAGVRFALWLPFLLITALTTCAMYLATIANQHSITHKKNFAFLVTSPILAALIGVGAIAICHPHYLPYWNIWLSRSLSNSANHTWGDSITSLLMGQTMTGGNLAWWYLPIWVLASLTLLAIVLVSVGTVVALKNTASKQSETLLRSSVTLVLLQAFALPIASILTGATMYNAQRQHLYVYPALAVLASIGVMWLLNLSESRPGQNGRSRTWSWVIAGVTAVGLIYPTIERLRLFPYEYVYLNEIATIGGYENRWETDYYHGSIREAITRVPADVYPYFYAPPENMNAYFYLRGQSYKGTDQAAPDEYWRVNSTLSGMGLPENCRDVDSVTRNFRGEDVVMSWVGICKELPGGRSATQ